MAVIQDVVWVQTMRDCCGNNTALWLWSRVLTGWNAWCKHTCVHIYKCVCVCKMRARSCAGWHVMEGVWSEGVFCQEIRREKKSWFSKLTAGSLAVGAAYFCVLMMWGFRRGRRGQVFNHSCQTKAANQASEVYMLSHNETKWRTDPWSALWCYAYGLGA